MADTFSIPSFATLQTTVTTVQGAQANYLPLAGGTLTGALTLAADPTSDMEAADKHYVDQKVQAIPALPAYPTSGGPYTLQYDVTAGSLSWVS